MIELSFKKSRWELQTLRNSKVTKKYQWKLEKLGISRYCFHQGICCIRNRKYLLFSRLELPLSFCHLNRLSIELPKATVDFLRHFPLNTSLREWKLLSLYMFHRIKLILLIVSSPSRNFHRCTGCFQSNINIACRNTQNAARKYHSLLKITQQNHTQFNE